MSTATIKLYNILVDKGVDRNVAQEAISEFLTREEALQTLSTKSDLEKAVRWLISVFIGIVLGQMAVMTGIIALMFSAYG